MGIVGWTSIFGASTNEMLSDSDSSRRIWRGVAGQNNQMMLVAFRFRLNFHSAFGFR